MELLPWNVLQNFSVSHFLLKKQHSSFQGNNPTYYNTFESSGSQNGKLAINSSESEQNYFHFIFQAEWNAKKETEYKLWKVN